jgi:HAD superfamily hydrolase (TIGR01549 family)
MTTNTPIPMSAILFDMGGTLLSVECWDPKKGNAKILEFAKDTHGYTADDIAEGIGLIDSDLYDRRESSCLELPPYTIDRLVYERLGIEFEIDFNEREAVFLHESRIWKKEPKIQESLDALSKKRIPMAVLSNSAFSGAALSRELESYNLLQHFTFVMSSADYVVRKPHPLIFLTAAAKLNTVPNMIWYVGDTPKYDVDGARSAGMIAVLYERKSKPMGVATPDFRFTDWTDFTDCALKAYRLNPGA